MHALTIQQRLTAHKTPAFQQPEWFPWKWAILTAVVAAGTTWTVFAARAPKVPAAPVAAAPQGVTLVVVPVDAAATPAAGAPHSSPEALELKRLETRNRRLEALVSVLRARSEEHPRK
jgi:hypothetical protein